MPAHWLGVTQSRTFIAGSRRHYGICECRVWRLSIATEQLGTISSSVRLQGGHSRYGRIQQRLAETAARHLSIQEAIRRWFKNHSTEFHRFTAEEVAEFCCWSYPLRWSCRDLFSKVFVS